MPHLLFFKTAYTTTLFLIYEQGISFYTRFKDKKL